MPSALAHASPTDFDGEGASQRTPYLVHNLDHDSSVLALAVDDEQLYAGTHHGQIVVWSLASYGEVHRIQAHKRAVLCLFITKDHSLLLSSASEPLVNVWDPKTMTRLYEVYSTWDSFGDIFSIAYSAQYDTLYYGTQAVTIQWVPLNDPERRVPHGSEEHPDHRNHRFFDSRAVGGASTPRPTDERYDLIPRARTVLEIDRRAIKQFAHYGFVYCMIIAKGATTQVDPEEEVLISGCGDGAIKVWKLGGTEVQKDGYLNGIQEIMCLEGDAEGESVLSLAIDGSFLYAGKLRGLVELWDLDTKQKLRVMKAHDGTVMSLSMGWGYLWSADATGTSTKHSTVHYEKKRGGSSQNVSQKYQCLSRWKAHDKAKILSSLVTEYRGHQLYITGANDNKVTVWSAENPSPAEQKAEETDEDMMVSSLREFVSYKTISSRPEYAEDCRRGATFLCTLLKRLGGDVEILSSSQQHHPVVFAKFGGKLESAEKRKRILFYGHYDVVPADDEERKWKSDPFQLKGTNGYLYGRGVSDNKGPIMAALYAVTDLMQAKSLDSDIIFLIEGEEESHSRGFQETVRQYKDRIGPIDYILLANSYWLNDDTPCLTYGLRGVLHATVCVESKHPDLHSGMDGSYMMSEPLSDLTDLMGSLKGRRNRVLIPGFYDGILPLTTDEDERYDDITSVLMERNPENGPAEAFKNSLKARWREPHLTIHRFDVSGPEGSLISSHARASISLRLVPGQEVDQVVESLKEYLQKEFEELESSNTLSIKIDNTAEPWLGDPGNYIFNTLEEAILEAWAPLFSHDAPEHGTTKSDNKPRKPLYIREGGSIPAIRFLEKEFEAPAAHLPCGQATDAAHLDNERLRVVNLFKSREIFANVFKKL